MKRLLAHESLAYVGHVKNILEQSGIDCIIKNDQLSGGLGEIPFLDCLPELWVVRDDELAKARSLVESSNAPATERKSWQCRHCGEANEGQFAACWHCGKHLDH